MKPPQRHETTVLDCGCAIVVHFPVCTGTAALAIEHAVATGMEAALEDHAENCNGTRIYDIELGEPQRVRV